MPAGEASGCDVSSIACGGAATRPEFRVALLDEIARSSDVVKRAYTEGQVAIIDDAAAGSAPRLSESARVQTLNMFALMVGTLQVSRALADQRLADEVLE